MYLVIRQLANVDVQGTLMINLPHFGDEKQPRPPLLNVRLVNLVKLQRYHSP